MAEAENRTEAATPKRREAARAQGNVALSREVAPAASMAAAALVLAWLLPPATAHLGRVLAALLDGAGRLAPLDAARLAGAAALRVAAPFAAAGALAAVAAALGQTGFSLRMSALQPSIDRLNLRRNLGRIAGPAALLEVARALPKVGVAGYALWRVLAWCRDWLLAAPLWQPATLLAHMARLGGQLLLAALATQTLVAGADVAWSRWSHARGLRMSRQEIRDEHREADGDPQIKARIRRIRMTRARRRMLAAVPKATVVVTNPTHYAVALVYDRAAGGAPRVVAKGVDAMAARIREAAAAARVPLVANPPLARALWRVDLDTEIPLALFQAVAEIIAYVWRLRTPGRRL